LLYKKHPSQLKIVLIDPKKTEFTLYSTIEKHFLAKLEDSEDAVISDVTKVTQTLQSVCKEMDTRFDLLKKAHVRNIKEYNEKFTSRLLNPENGHRYLPYMVVIIDEFADLIMTAGKEVEMPIARIAQLARAAGIHMIIATQRPSTNIITGSIKANFPGRLAFRVSSMIDSRTILDSPGANQLIGRGDLLFSQGNDLTRVQCAFVDTPEVEAICNFISEQQGYTHAFYLPEIELSEGDTNMRGIDMTQRDAMFEDAARLVVLNQSGSTSMIQRKFSIGYNRAGRIMDQLEAAGIVGAQDGSKGRQVLVMDEAQLERILETL
jgi:S-DNA-T family DNA segregation ATPase FtsK/SpoIIIE